MAIAACACALAAVSAQAAEFAPIDAPGPALSIDLAQLRASVSCSDDVATNPRPPVLLVPATTVTSRENFSWSWQIALRRQGFATCTTDMPGRAGQNMDDMQTRAEYIVYAIRRVHRLSGGKRISIVGHSQGGMIWRWALRFWPDTRRMVGDAIGMAPTNHGSDVINTMCAVPCAPAIRQQGNRSDWTRALNSYKETFSGIDYTVIYSTQDEFVRPDNDDNGTSSLHGREGRISNIAIQDLCPLDVDEHLLIGTMDVVAWALGLDALTHPGPADEHRLSNSVCSRERIPGFDPVAGWGPFGGAVLSVVWQLAAGPKSNSEPPLRCYVTATCSSPSRRR
jgi:pimeloyl-ACP methyl ester carboxylesterase